ncbi:hypothetical protein Sjap_009967 [Stephania japonica]|uniref:Uncharacterized protein n=1 Tax=Stephania japonica TaxID=461633 RepID=A0AAP0JAA1_9MAGN
MLVVPHGGSGGNCSTTGCVVDLNGACPAELKVVSSAVGGRDVACRSACEAFQQPQYCCSGDKKASQSQNPQAADLPLYNSTMVFLGGQDLSAAAHRGSFLPIMVAVVGAMWRLSELMF